MGAFPERPPHAPTLVPPGLRPAWRPGLLGVSELPGGVAEDRRLL